MSENIHKDSDVEYWDSFYAQLNNQPKPEPEVLPWRIMVVERFIIWCFDHIYAYLPSQIISAIAKKGQKLNKKRFDTNRVITYIGNQEVWDTAECAEKGYVEACEKWRWDTFEEMVGKRINPMTYDDEMYIISEACQRAYCHAKNSLPDSSSLGDFAWFCFIPYEKILCVVLWIKGYKEKTIPMININL